MGPHWRKWESGRWLCENWQVEVVQTSWGAGTWIYQPTRKRRVFVNSYRVQHVSKFQNPFLRTEQISLTRNGTAIVLIICWLSRRQLSLIEQLELMYSVSGYHNLQAFFHHRHSPPSEHDGWVVIPVIPLNFRGRTHRYFPRNMTLADMQCSMDI